ncbi:MAG: flagellar basal-body rod protein FlgB [Candidatus Krumholzibacteriia bacterium]|jgi:flagellar basal-body rod protein FlgB
MIKTGLFDKAHLSNLKKAVDVYAQRHQVTSQNISNVETPGFRAQKLKFEEMLDNENMRMRGYSTHRNHIPIGNQGVHSARESVEDANVNFDNGVNNVDIDQEMTTLATNDLSYRMATRLLSQRYNVLRGAIKGHIG